MWLIPAHRGRFPEADRWRSGERHPRAEFATSRSGDPENPPLGTRTEADASGVRRRAGIRNMPRRSAERRAPLRHWGAKHLGQVLLACRVMARQRCGDPHPRFSALRSLMPSVMEMREGRHPEVLDCASSRASKDAKPGSQRPPRSSRRPPGRAERGLFDIVNRNGPRAGGKPAAALAHGRALVLAAC